MKNGFCLRMHLVSVLSAALLAGAAVPAHAGLFGKDSPVPQWGLDAAKTPTPANIGDASSVVLFDEYVETIDGQGRAVEREREAIRILKPQARHEFCAVSYDVDEKINYFREWTLAADGKTFQAKDTDFIDVGAGEEDAVRDIPILLQTEKTRIVHPPAEDMGATILCESEELMAPWRHEMVWRIQEGIPFVFEALEIDLPPGGYLAESWHRYQPVKPVEVEPNHWRWVIKDMPRLDLRDVKSSPSWEALAARMSVYWGGGATSDESGEWRALGQWATDIEEHRPDPSPEITAKAQELTEGTSDFFTKLTNITAYIQKNIRYFIIVRGIGGWQAHPAGDIFRNRYGDCKDKTTLLISMLQVVDIKAFYMPVDDHRGFVDPNAPSLAGDHMITAILLPPDVKDPRLLAVVTAKDGNRYLIFDPTNERTPVGNLPSYLQGGYGLLAAGPSSQIIELPVLDPSANGTDESGKFTLAADGTLTGSVDTLHFGPEGADLRQFLKFTDQKERRDAWEKHVARDVPGVVLDSFQFVEPDSLAKPLEFHFTVTAHQYAHTAGPLLLVRPRVLFSMALHFDDKPRKVPFDLEATGRWNDSYDIALPAGYVVDETPDPVDLDMDFASYHASVTAKGNLLHYERELTVRQVELPAERAADFRKFESAILSDEKGTAVLRRQ
jgi:hypothetical protein